MGNNSNLSNSMRENKIARKLENSIVYLLPVPGLDIVVEHGRSRRCDLFIRANYQGLCFDIIVEVVSLNSLPAFKNKINRLKASVGHPRTRRKNRTRSPQEVLNDSTTPPRNQHTSEMQVRIERPGRCRPGCTPCRVQRSPHVCRRR